MLIESLKRKCAGNCGTEQELKGQSAELWMRHKLKWWCQPCADRVGDEMLLAPILVALERQSDLRARLRRLILVEDE